MASHPEHRPPPTAPAAPITIRDLSDDLLREILLRLPSLPSLVRAALACRAFLAAVCASPAFRRRFRAQHPPPLLGFFDDHFGNETPTFRPLRRRSDRDLAAALRGLDVLLTRVPRQDDVFHSILCRHGEPDEEFFLEWQIVDCHGGCLLLLNGRTKQLAAYNPLSGALDLVPRVVDEISKGHFFNSADAEYFLVTANDEASDRLSFRVVSFCHDGKSQVRFVFFSSATGKWQILPVSEHVLSLLTYQASGIVCVHRGIHVNGFLCWSHPTDEDPYMVLLDTVTLQFSAMDMPPGLGGRGCFYRVGDTKDGKLSIVAATDFTLSIWFRTSDANGVDKWVLQNVIQLEGEVLGATEGSRNELEKLIVFATVDSIVYMTTYERFRDVGMPCCCWYLSFCLETRKLEKIFYVKTEGLAHLYFMPWPTSLVEMEHPAEGEREKLGNEREVGQ